jgi:hypothetical protein
MLGGIFTGLALAFGVVASWYVLTPSAPVATRTEQLTYSQQATKVEINVESGDVRVVGGASQVWMERSLEYRTRRPTFSETWRGDTLVIHARCELSGLDKARGEQCGVGYVLRVPATVDVEASVDQGTIRVDDIDGELRLSTGAGDVEIHNAQGRVHVRTNGGMITATGLRSVEADARTAYGDVSLDFVVPPALARASTDFGDVEVALPRGDDAGTTYQVRVVAPKSVGFIDVPSDPSSPNQVFATVPYGDVYIRYSSG